MNFLGWAILAFVAFVILVSRYLSTRKYALGPIIKIGELRFDQPFGSKLKTHEPVHVQFDYTYDNADYPLCVWAKVDSEDLVSTYQGSVDQMKPGTGKIVRYFYLKKPGRIREVLIEAKNEDLDIVFSQVVEVDYQFESNPEAEARAEDGMGSRVVSVSLSHPDHQDIVVGEQVSIKVEYEVDSTEGVDLWAVPMTDLKMSYEGSHEKLNGAGTVSKSFVISEPGSLTSIRLVMENAAGEIVYSNYVEVHFNFVNKDD